MATTQFKGNPAQTVGALPQVGQTAPDFVLVDNGLADVTLATYAGKKKVISIFPSVDTGVCAAAVRAFNKKAGELSNTVILNVSCDLPFAQKRFCGAEGIEAAVTVSAFRSSFPEDYGIRLVDSPLKGLCARAVLVLNEQNVVTYVELVSEVTTEPNYEAAFAAL